MKADDRFYTINNTELFCDGGCVEIEKGSNVNLPIFNHSNINDFIQKLNSLKVPYVNATYSNLESKDNIVVYVTISLDSKNSWNNKIIENSRYSKFRIERNGTIEKIAGNLSKFKKSFAKTQDDVISKLNSYLLSPEKYNDGGNLEIQTPYYPASDVCESLNTLVPSAMATELQKFNEGLKAYIENKYNMSIAEYVAMKLHYNSVDDLCYDPIKKDEVGNRIVRFAQEQIDAIATAIYSHEEKGDAIIIADQTGVGKGRTAAGLIRYAILEKKVIPFFFTEKKHLINDIYRDLVDIGFDAGIIEQEKTQEIIKKEDWSEEEILSIIYNDIKEKEDFSVEYDLPEGFNISWLKDFDKMNEDTVKSAKGSDKSFDFDRITEIMDEVIALYTTMLIEKGKSIIKYVNVPKEKLEKQIRQAEKEGKMRLRPFFPNDEEIVDKEGNVIYGRIGPTKLKEIFGYEKDEKGKWIYDYNKNPDDLVLPNEFKVFTIPFSQVNQFEEIVNGNVVTSPKFRFFQKYANNSVIIIDEAHAASGSNPDNPSNTFKALSDIIDRSSMITYLSATYAKRETNMPLYAKATSMRESGLSDREMIETFLSGGNALKEAVSSELTRNGQLLRREKQIQGKSDYYYGNPDSNDLNIKNLSLQQVVRLNTVADIFNKLRVFQQEVHELIADYKDELPEVNPFAPEDLSGTKKEIERQRTIKALTFQMFNFFLLGLKIDQTTQFAIEKLKNGIKPIITIANTLESALKNMPKTYKTDDEKDRYKVGETINNDFNLYLAYLLFYTMHWKKNYIAVSDEGVPTMKSKIVCVFEDRHDLSAHILGALGSRYDDLLQEILTTTTGVSIAPIDVIKSKILKEGYSIDEITGRQLQVEFDGDDYTKGTIRKRIRKDTTSLVREFNENAVDCLFINQAGAVGISMHARPVGRAKIVYPIIKEEIEVDGKKETIESGWPTSLENKDEVKKRAMIITQMELDINKEVQKLGRINRTGQVYPPEFTYIISAVPSENRLTALMEKKLRSLSANVSSNQQQSSYLFESEDFFSITAIVPFNETISELRRQYPMLNTVRLAREGLEAGADDIKDFTKFLYFVDYNLQKDFYETFSKKLNEHIQKQIADGLYVGKVGKKDYKAETLSKHPFYIGNENARTSFGRHSFLEKAYVMEYKNKNTDRDVYLEIANRFQFTRFSVTGTNDNKQRLIRFKKAAKAELNQNVEKNKKAVNEELDRINDLIKTKTEQLKERNKELSKYGDVAKIVELEISLNEVKDKIKALRVTLTEIMETNPEKIGEIGSEMAVLNNEQKGIEAKLNEFGDVSQLKSEFRVLEREIKSMTKDIESLNDDLVKYDNAKNDYSKLMKLIDEKIDMIGKVFVIKRYEETYDTINELGEVTSDIQKYGYRLISSEICVVTGVTFPEYEQKIIPSSVNVYFMTITESFSEALSRISPKISQIDSGKGKKSTIELISENVNFDDEYVGKDKNKTTYWNNLAKETDTGSKVTKWFVVGSVLKSYMLSKRNGYTGEILKFTMKNNIDRIGIEITNKIDPNDPQKSTYNDLDKRYDDDTALQYPIYFDANNKNIDSLMTDYIYHYLLGRLYDLKPEDLANFDYNVNRNTKFIFYISSVSNSQIVINPGQYLLEECIETFDKIKYGKFDVNDKIEKQDFVQQLDVLLVSDSIRFSDVFAIMLQRTGVNIDEYNYKISNNSKYESLAFKDVGKTFFSNISANVKDIFKTIFPIQLENTRQDLANKQAITDYVSTLSMSYNDYLKTLEEFERENQKPTFSIGSDYFKTQKHLYILEQFMDNVTDVKEVAPDELQFIPVEKTDIEKQINSMIDNLLKIIVNE